MVEAGAAPLVRAPRLCRRSTICTSTGTWRPQRCAGTLHAAPSRWSWSGGASRLIRLWRQRPSSRRSPPRHGACCSTAPRPADRTHARVLPPLRGIRPRRGGTTSATTRRTVDRSCSAEAFDRDAGRRSDGDRRSWLPRRNGTRRRSAVALRTGCSKRRRRCCGVVAQATRDRDGRRLRAVADGRLPHAVPALRRGAGPGADVASDLPRAATASRRFATRRAAIAGGALGRAARHQPAGASPAVAPATCTSRRSTADCSRRPARRSSNGATWTTRPRGDRCWRCRTRPAADRRGPRADRLPRAGRRATRAPSTRPCSTTSPRRRRRGTAARKPARVRCVPDRRPQGDRHVLHAAIDRPPISSGGRSGRWCVTRRPSES